MGKAMVGVVCGLGLLLAAGTASAKERTVKGPDTEGTAEYAIIKAFEAAIAGDFDAYLTVVHSEHKETRDQRSQRERYEWKRFKKQHEWYLKSKKPVTFVITSVREEGTKHKRIFVKDQTHPKRMPVPVRLKKDGDAWKITVSSL